MPTAVGHGLVGPEPSGTIRNWERLRPADSSVLRDQERAMRRFGEWATGINIPTHDGRGSCQMCPLRGTSDESL